jgi:hypothetical protein
MAMLFRRTSMVAGCGLRAAGRSPPSSSKKRPIRRCWVVPVA